MKQPIPISYGEILHNHTLTEREEDKVRRDKGYPQCPRCKKHTPSCNFDSLCNKCVDLLLTHYPTHESMSYILANLEERGLKPSDNPIRI